MARSLDGTGGRSPFPPIADYGFLSDCEVNALVAPTGAVEWLCLPRPDSPTVFGAMLDRGAGTFRLGPAEIMVPAGRRYLPGTMVLETTWMTRSGWIDVRDTLVIGTWYEGEERSAVWRRPPGDHQAEHILLRTVKCIDGHVELNMDCEPVFDHGRRNATWRYVGPGYHDAVAAGGPDDPELRLTTDLRLGFEGRAARARTTLSEGETAFVALSWSDHPAPSSYGEAARKMQATEEFWREWLNHGEFPDHPWRWYLQRSALTLKGLTYAPTGALLAAATTSLPETPGGERNWDYRYAWIRDATFALWALYTLGLDAEADDFFYFVADACAGPEKLQVLYGVGGERQIDEHVLDHLTGYDGARPVRVGNDAYRQRQHDMWGALLDSIYLHTKTRDQLPEQVWPIITDQVEETLRHWRDPDRGIWEVRGEPQHFTSSKLMCWVAVDRGARLARLHDDPELAARWEKAAQEIKDDILGNGVDARGVFVQHYGGTALDASLLLVPLVRFLPADDPRVRATVEAIADGLTRDGLVHRYRAEETDDGLHGEEGAFVICSFWLVSALAEMGEVDRAREVCERILGYASALNLFAEEVDPRTGRHLGNFPQAFTHLAMINALMHIIRAEEQGDPRRFEPARPPTA
ncbi:MAG: glycoside hydrolase family 15 protein [Actinomycetota bacterium]